MIIIWIKHLTDSSCKILLLYCFLIITLVKWIKVKCINRFCIPNSESIYHVVVVTYNRKVIRYCSYRLIIFLNKLVSSTLIFSYSNITSKLNLNGIFRSLDFKRISIFEPVIRSLNLITVFNNLLKHSVFIANTASVCRIS